MCRCCDGLGELNGEAGDLQLPNHRLLRAHPPHLGLSAKRDDSHLHLGFPRPLGEVNRAIGDACGANRDSRIQIISATLHG